MPAGSVCACVCSVFMCLFFVKCILKHHHKLVSISSLTAYSLSIRLRGVNDLLAQSKKIMNLMWRRTVENKIIMAVIIGLLVLMIAFVVRSRGLSVFT